MMKQQLRSRSFFLSLIILLFGGLSTVRAQWEIQAAPEFGGGSIRAIAEVTCASMKMVLAGTTEGIFLDRTGNGVQGQWVDVSDGLPEKRREVRAIAVRDSIVFIALYGEGVYYSYVSPLNVLPCRPLTWQFFGKNLEIPHVNDLVLSGTRLFAGTDGGVFGVSVATDSLRAVKHIATTNTWSQIDQNFGKRVFTLAERKNNLFAGTFLNGTHYYDTTCITTANCSWHLSTPTALFPNYSFYDITSVAFDSTFIKRQSSDSIPCKGVLIASGRGENLFFSPILTPDSIPAAIDFWLNISPSAYNPQWDWKINAILTGNFPGAPHSIFVAAEFGGIFMSEDCGTTWREINNDNTGAPALRGADVRTLNTVRDSVILAGADGAGIFKGGTFARTTARMLKKNAVTGINAQNDTLRKENKITVTTDSRTENAAIKVDLKEDYSQVEVVIYNFLGKKVMDVTDCQILQKSRICTFNTSALPSGMYICVAQGIGVKFAEKFIISR